MKNDLRNVLSGKSQVRYGELIQTITSYLGKSKTTSTETSLFKHRKEQEEESLVHFICENNLWVSIDLTQYVSEGAEQKVYLNGSHSVTKINDAIYYESWLDYFHNLLLHNFFFPDTAYQLLGFIREDKVLYAVVEQSYVSITSTTDLSLVKQFMKSNGFRNIRNNDYQNDELGLILEDLHDENVLTKDGILYFIDTVFYLTEEFWQ